MNVTLEIAKDLLPLYVSGEASLDSRAAVEAFLREDPALGRAAAALRETNLARSTVPVPPSAGRASLERTKALLRRRTWLLALALFFSGLPLTFVFDDSGLRFLLMRDAPMFGSTCLMAAAGLWVAFGVTVRRLRVTGL